MKTRPVITRLFLLALCLGLPAFAAQTQIAQVPLLNISGTGTVKPNLMLLFDNSGSMEQTYTPDYVNDNLCRTSSRLANGVTSCTVGHPPFMSPDFNKQYYNPQIRYQPPIKADGTYYPEQTAAATANWTNVASDGFGKQNVNLYGNGDTAIDLTTQFPDLRWCDPDNTSDCKVNSATYTYPDNTYTAAGAISTGPYYYTIGVAEYCTDAAMKTCVSTTAGAAAPSGYPVPALVRWCDTRNLTNCQAKRVGSFLYPRYSQALGAAVAYGTVTIGASRTSSALTINSIVVNDPDGNRTVTNGAVSAPNGTNTALKQQTLASALASSIMARTGTTYPYLACVKNPIGVANVPACSTFGINLASDSVLAILPVSCSGSKSVATCQPYYDNSRSGWGITVDATSTRLGAPTGLLRITGSTANNRQASLANVALNGNNLFTNLALGTNGGNTSAATAATAIVNRIGTSGTVRAYAGGNGITPTCAQAAEAGTVCLVDTANNAPAKDVTVGNLSNRGTMTIAPVDTFVDVDTIPTTVQAISAGSGAPSTFARVNIVSGRTYPKSLGRTDCAGSTCTYAEEMTNFANWYSYYKSRLQMMKTSVGIAFTRLNGNYRVGYVRLSSAGAGNAVELKPADFTGTARTSWYSTLYNTTTSGSTPIRTAMDNVGRMYANLTPYNYASGQEVVQYPCQQNFLILTTDGYWNGNSTANVVNNDDRESATRFCLKKDGCVDTRSQSQPSISDVALHWYNGGSSTGTVSLRPDLEPNMLKPGLVPAAAGENTHLHMTTYTLGLGVDGVMNYEPKYDSAPIVNGDFFNLKSGVTSGCPWNGGGAYVWPDPQVTSTASTVQERVDDLWHAAINGHGKYFSASQPKDVVAGLQEALDKMQVSVGAAAAAATSTPNISLEDNDIFSSTFTTVKWFGVLSKRNVDTATGIVDATPVWTTATAMGGQVATSGTAGATTDGRTIWMRDGATTDLKPFYFANMSAAEKAWFTNKCPLLTQCTLLDGDNRALVNAGTELVNWLRGQQQHADDVVFRAYSSSRDADPAATATVPVVLGDIASSKPAYMRDPRKAYTLSGYETFKSTYAGRAPAVFVAANDGMLHAFNAADGSAGGRELWAYVPRITMQKLPVLASTTYGTNHQYTTDGSPELADVQIGGQWRTILVAGLNGGGRGYYALDVTDAGPAWTDAAGTARGGQRPKLLWELCADAALCPQSRTDANNIGLTFGAPQFGMHNGRWVVYLTSGYNNVPGVDNVNTGDGKGYLFIVDVATGEVLDRVSTNLGDTTTPSGLARITAISNDPATDPVTTYIYGGDNQGNLFRFDLTAAASVKRIGIAAVDGVAQPITARPDVTLCAVTTTADSGATAQSAQRVVMFGTGRLLDLPDIGNTDVQSLYALRDDGAADLNLRGSTMVAQTLSQRTSTEGTGDDAVTTIDEIDLTGTRVDLSRNSGWYFDWKLNAGERMNLDPKIVSGVGNVVTNVPTSESSCSVGGTSNFYAVDVCKGTGVNGTLVGSMLSNTSAAVGFIIVRLPKGDLKLITTTAKGETLTRPLQELDTVGAHRAGWRRVKGD
ncbi:pilus assembly protein [Pseudoduganella chitinolytica]|uniref:PilC/PilY family type IV pilus protein n=1 Tax=Pseudoduganella chitinolytica TaxID=34070 RepID=A0ABY8BGN5_9BURK|nr:PilC/PilY family type IV pilus protein [Pseudoduganella chitinolytica]WEF34131.1 PilC/PilY family type IV pilus protein [Pseudoduganella chitinolytica]